jgi:hypothetical protein
MAIHRGFKIFSFGKILPIFQICKKYPHFIWKSFRVTVSKDLPNYNIPSNCETIGIQTIFCSENLTLL